MNPETPSRFPGDRPAALAPRVERHEGAHVLLFTVLGAALALCVLLLLAGWACVY